MAALATLGLVVAFGVMAPVVVASPAAAATNAITLKVVSARTEPRAFGGTGVAKGAEVSTFSYLVSVDNTGTTEQRSPAPGTGCASTDPDYPASCAWPSIQDVPHASTVYTHGDQSDFAGGATLDLPDGRYLISVLADGYKIDGVHVTMPLDSAAPVVVELQPDPLPDGTLRAQVFADISPTDGTLDAGDPGLAHFVGHINDYLGLVTTDVYGNPLCTTYVGEDPVSHQIPLDSLDADMAPVVDVPGGTCESDADGLLTIPHLGSNRYALSVTPPDGQTWIQTTTLEGNHDWDAWVMEGATGFDTEFTLAGEAVPQPIFGFVKPIHDGQPLNASASGHITGLVETIKAYTPPKGGSLDFWSGKTGTRADKPMPYPWLSLSDLQNGDQAVWVGRGAADGSFDIAGVPDGDYTLSWWDEPQDYLLGMTQVTVHDGQVEDLGNLPLNGWWTTYDGYVFNDTNRNGAKDPGEPGVPNFTLTMRRQENSLMDRGQTSATTDATGHYSFEAAYPLGEWSVMEAYSDSFYTTGVTYQADNQPQPTTVKGAGVDVSVLNIIGLSGRMDWGVHAYDPTGRNGGIDPQNGGIVGTVSYDTTRNELDPQYAAVEDWQPGVSDLPVELFAPVDCGTTGAPCDANEQYELAPDGSYAQGKLLNTYVTESWSRPTGCTARDVDGNALVHGVDENVLVPNQSTDGVCLSGPLQSVQFGPYPTDQGTPDANFGAAVDGNYGFGDACFDGTLDATDPSAPVCDGGTFTPLGVGDYLVHVSVPEDASGTPSYQFTREEDINIGNGDQIVPQVPPPACAGALHTVDLAGDGTDGYPAVVGDGGLTNELPAGVTVPASDPVDNATFLDIGGSPFEGTAKPRCDTKLVRVNNGKSIVPTFNVFTDVPIPSRLRGLVVDDINYSTDPRTTLYGEKAGVPFVPVGIYDYSNRLVDTVESDFNGIYDVLLPSTNHISCPTPSGVCANMYRFVANDPGAPGRLNPNYNPRYRTIATEFEALPGLIIPTDLAPTQVGTTISSPSTGLPQGVLCTQDPVAPQLLAVSKPYVSGSGSFTITGTGLGATKGTGTVTLDGTIVLPTTAWDDKHIDVTVPAGTPPGPHQLAVRADNGMSTVNGLTFHVLSGPAVPAFPAGGVLDAFNRSTASTTQALGSGWGGLGLTLSNANYRITPSTPAATANQAQLRGGGGNVFLSSGAALGPNQDAFVTFTKTVPAAANRQAGVLLKAGGLVLGAPTTYVAVRYNATSSTVTVTTSASPLQALAPLTQATFPGVTFADGDRLGARVLADGTVTAYKNGTAVGSVNIRTTANPWPAALSAAGGRIGLSSVAPGAATFAPPNDVRLDDFGGGNVTVGAAGYQPNVYEVGPGRTFATIQSAIDAAYASAGNDLVVVYPGQPDLANPFGNPRGAYYENLIMASPIKLQGVGPGGFQGSTFVPGSIIDAGAFGGDTALATAWYAKIGTLTWDGNQSVYDGQALYVLASQNPTTAAGAARQFTAAYPASIDGFDIRGGDQQGFPGNINDVTGGPTGLPANVVTQGGAIYANAYVRNLQITNNVVQNNGGAYGTIRIGTPDLPAPDTNQHNEDVRIAHNRLVANAGTNLAGAVGLFTGADRYDVADNDICGNFSLEYGGGVSVYGLSPNGKIHDNRIYYNTSNDEGGAIMVAGQLPATAGDLSPGTGPVDIYGNQIQANLANDDGGGIRFLMAGNFPDNVYDNVVANNVSTHEGGGIAIDDAPNVRVFNNTIMKNLTTATAVTSNGQPAPAGLSTGANSDQLQATLPAGSPAFSKPLLFNNIFWDNRAGTRGGTTVSGLGLVGDAAPVDEWDLGVADGSGALAPTSSVVQQDSAVHPYAVSGTNTATDPGVVDPYDLSVSFATWRQNPAFVDATLSAVEVPANQLGNYHLSACPGSSACNLGAASVAVPAYQQPGTTLAAPSTDIDHQARPALGGFDAGADEAGATAGGGGPAAPVLWFSTFGSTNPPGVTGTADDADVYSWNGSAFARSVDVSAMPAPLPAGANVDGYSRIDDTHFYLSFNGSVTIAVPGPDLVVQDEDVVRYDAGTWSLFFDGSARGVGPTDLDAISVDAGGTLYFSTATTFVPPGAGGSGDDADVYRWNGGSSFTRVADASALGWSTANVDGLVWVDATHVLLSYASDTTAPGGVGVQDEDVVQLQGTTWSTFFDGTAAGLTAANQDLDAFDVP
ncbi:SdrD B-like domain-containing protein [Cellulomonas sp. ICMP 17802]|uniref:SdrD B-like domain-containing protein n=1 Tax=Cellulomonas sp. ICMP 17802 TaxID=3239199 RepID=UPI00351B873C